MRRNIRSRPLSLRHVELLQQPCQRSPLLPSLRQQRMLSQLAKRARNSQRLADHRRLHTRDLIRRTGSHFQHNQLVRTESHALRVPFPQPLTRQLQPRGHWNPRTLRRFSHQRRPKMHAMRTQWRACYTSRSTCWLGLGCPPPLLGQRSPGCRSTGRLRLSRWARASAAVLSTWHRFAYTRRRRVLERTGQGSCSGRLGSPGRWWIGGCDFDAAQPSSCQPPPLSAWAWTSPRCLGESH
jgi:hypothetical protein